MRIVAGKFRSRQLKTAPLPGTRPTSDRLRETLFNVLAPRLPGCTFLDAYAGMGAVGLEALSRGAAQAVFVDQARKACRIIRQNLRLLNVTEGFEVLEMDVAKALNLCSSEQRRFDIAFFDPPYDLTGACVRDLHLLSGLGLVSPEGIAVYEHARKAELPEIVDTFERYRVLPQGDSCLSFYRTMEVA